MSDHVFDDPRITAMGLLAEAYHGVVAHLTAQLADHKLSPVEFEVLLRLARSDHGQLRMTDLAAQTQLTTSGITRVVDRLERSGLVCRNACPTDRRSLYARITQPGRDRLREVLPEHIATIERWFTGQLPAGQLDRLLEGLRTVRDAARPGSTAGATPRSTAGATAATTGGTAGPTAGR